MLGQACQVFEAHLRECDADLADILHDLLHVLAVRARELRAALVAYDEDVLVLALLCRRPRCSLRGEADTLRCKQ